MGRALTSYAIEVVGSNGALAIRWAVKNPAGSHVIAVVRCAPAGNGVRFDAQGKLHEVPFGEQEAFHCSACGGLQLNRDGRIPYCRHVKAVRATLEATP